MKCFLPFPLYSSPRAVRVHLTDLITSSFPVYYISLENFAFFLVTTVGKNFLCSVLRHLQNLSCGGHHIGGGQKNASSPSLYMCFIAAEVEDLEEGM